METITTSDVAWITTIIILSAFTIKLFYNDKKASQK